MNNFYPGLCKHQPTILITIPIFFIIFSLFFKAISIQNCKCFHIWICTLDPENSTPSPQTPSPTILYFFIIFFLFYSYFFIYHSNPIHIWKCALDPENSTPSPPTPSPTIPYFSLIFRLFYCYFSFSFAILSIFGNMQQTLTLLKYIPGRMKY